MLPEDVCGVCGGCEVNGNGDPEEVAECSSLELTALHISNMLNAVVVAAASVVVLRVQLTLYGVGHTRGFVCVRYYFIILFFFYTKADGHMSHTRTGVLLDSLRVFLFIYLKKQTPLCCTFTMCEYIFIIIVSLKNISNYLYYNLLQEKKFISLFFFLMTFGRD